MENETQSENMFINEIGQIAKIIDKEMTIFERMKVNKDNLKRVGLAVIFYLAAMLVFAIFL